MHLHKPIFKTLRTINKEALKDEESVSPNLFGFTSVLLRRRLNLTVVSKEFLVTYELKHKDFEDIVSQSPIDFETVCQLRDYILNTSPVESYEGPELVDPRMHFAPIKQIVVRKSQQRLPQARKYYSRSGNRKNRCRFEIMDVPADPNSLDLTDNNQNPTFSMITPPEVSN